MSLTDILVLIALIMIVTGGILGIYIFPAIWTYKDAKERGLNALFWTIEVLFINLTGGFLCLGFIVYLIARIFISKIRCPKCNDICDKKAVYCPSCGDKISRDEIKSFSKKHNKFLFGILAGAIMMILGVGIFIGTAYNNIPKPFENVSVGKVENSWNDEWTVKAKSSNETLTETFRIDEEEPGVLKINGSCDEGTLTLHIIGGDTSETISLNDSYDKTIEIDLSEFSSNSIQLILVNEDVQGLHFKADWSND